MLMFFILETKPTEKVSGKFIYREEEEEVICLLNRSGKNTFKTCLKSYHPPKYILLVTATTATPPPPFPQNVSNECD